MKLGVMVFAGFLACAGASAQETRELYRDSKSEYCEALQLRILTSVDLFQNNMYPLEIREDAIEEGTQFATIYTALCKD